MKDFFTIIGGMGTPATESFIRLLNARTPAKRDQDYLDYVLVNHATIPDRSSYLMDNSKPNPFEDVLDDIKTHSKLNPNFFVMACNTVHYFYDQLQKETKIPILHMPRETVRHIKENYPDVKKVGILGTPGTITDGIYDQELKKNKLEIIKPSNKIQELTNQLIFDKIKKNNNVDIDLFYKILELMTGEQQAEIVILGCTELSYAQEFAGAHKYLIADSQSVLVDKTIETAMKSIGNI